jgi:hypothetical protein
LNHRALTDLLHRYRQQSLAPKITDNEPILIKITSLPPGTELEDEDVKEEIENEFVEGVDAVGNEER